MYVAAQSFLGGEHTIIIHLLLAHGPRLLTVPDGDRRAAPLAARFVHARAGYRYLIVRADGFMQRTGSARGAGTKLDCHAGNAKSQCQPSPRETRVRQAADFDSGYVSTIVLRCKNKKLLSEASGGQSAAAMQRGPS
jgi:hypothetical protein